MGLIWNIYNNVALFCFIFVTCGWTDTVFVRLTGITVHLQVPLKKLCYANAQAVYFCLPVFLLIHLDVCPLSNPVGFILFSNIILVAVFPFTMSLMWEYSNCSCICTCRSYWNNWILGLTRYTLRQTASCIKE